MALSKSCFSPNPDNKTEGLGKIIDIEKEYNSISNAELYSAVSAVCTSENPMPFI